jgi:AhpD family alkylhydroperoxidase
MTKRADYRAASPDGVKALLGAFTYVENCGLPKTLIDLVCLRASQINGCAFCIDMHSRSLLNQKVAADKLMLLSVWREARALFSAQEQAALHWAERVTQIAGHPIEDSEYESARKIFSEKELADLTISVGLINAFNRLGITFNATPVAVQKLERAAAAK